MPILQLFGMLFEWHDDKFELVHKKRGITLEEVASVFCDDNFLEKADFGDYDEPRTLTIGMSNQARLLVVAWTQRENTIRIITAFFPTKHQEKEYVNARY
ncbi:BrnT family toxin [Glaesserella sp.]|uniref:BrnT family toxin n=1 Tax=Glaesserella sp. TaxID=2094731 RepID=UPI0035A12663